MARNLTLRLDDETDDALRALEELQPQATTADVIRDALSERGSCVYFVRRSDGAVKVGFTTSLKLRLQTLRLEFGKLKLEAVMPGGRLEEVAMHEKLSSVRVHGEWFRGELVEQEIRGVVLLWGPADVASWSGSRALANVLFVRLGVDLASRLDECVEKERIKRPGRNISRSDVIRELLFVALVGGLS